MHLEARPDRLRAVYPIIRHPVEDRLVQGDWVRDHREYDRLFGHSRS